MSAQPACQLLQRSTTS